MNLNSIPFYDVIEKDDSDTYKVKINNIESMNDILRKTSLNVNKNLNNEDENKKKKELKSQNRYFMGFLNDNLSRIMNQRRISGRCRTNSFLNIDELRNFKKRASFIGKDNYMLKDFLEKTNKSNAHKPDMGDFHEAPLDIHQGQRKRYSINCGIQPRFFNSYNINYYNNQDSIKKENLLSSIKSRSRSNTNTLPNLNSMPNELNTIYASEATKSIKRYDTPHLQSQYISTNNINKANTLSSDSNNNIRLHPRLSMRINRFINEINMKSLHQSESNDMSLNSLNNQLDAFEEEICKKRNLANDFISSTRNNQNSHCNKNDYSRTNSLHSKNENNNNRKSNNPSLKKENINNSNKGFNPRASALLREKEIKKTEFQNDFFNKFSNLAETQKQVMEKKENSDSMNNLSNNFPNLNLFINKINNDSSNNSHFKINNKKPNEREFPERNNDFYDTANLHRLELKRLDIQKVFHEDLNEDNKSIQ